MAYNSFAAYNCALFFGMLQKRQKSQHLSSPSFNRKILSSFSEIAASLFAFLQSQNPRVPPSRLPPSYHRRRLLCLKSNWGKNLKS
ncbi:hypothetical protein P8452_13727 [Trifolium repens]|nr:hypothetical protein P8452_13727 [Trifolium repens]